MTNRTQDEASPRRHHAVTVIGFLVAMVDGYDTLMLAFIAPLIGCLCVGALLIALLGHGIVSPGNSKFLLVFAVGLLIIGAQGGIPALCVHLYPASVYATAVGLSVACGRLGSILGPLAGGYLIAARLGWSRLFLWAAIPAIAAAIAMTALAATGRREEGRG